MKATALTRAPRQARRLGEVLRTMARYGLADRIRQDAPAQLQRWFTEPDGRLLSEYTAAERLRMALTDLGPTFIKLGQMLSTRSDIVNPEIAAELTKLQSDVPADPPHVVREIVEMELGKPIGDLFLSFNDQPLGSASIGQVHEATLLDGTAVVIKVQRQGIEKTVYEDLEILIELAQMAEKYSSELRQYRPLSLASEFKRSLLRELDFTIELRNLEQFARNFAANPDVTVPHVYHDLSTRYVLTMEKLNGYSIQEKSRMLEDGVDAKAFAERFTNACLDMVFRDGFYHADPHPGNIFVLPGGEVGLIDCGKVGWVDEELKTQFSDIIRDLLAKDAYQLTDDLIRLCDVPPDLDRGAYRTDISIFMAEFGDLSENELDIGGLVNNMFALIRKHRLALPGRVTMFLQVLVILDGSGRWLDPDYNLVSLIRPYQEKIALNRISPEYLGRQFMRSARDWDRLLSRLPYDLGVLLDRVQQGNLQVQVSHHGLNKPVNRLIYALLIAALLVASAVVLATAVPPLLGQISLLGLLGLLFAISFGFRLLRAISKSDGL